MTVLGAPWEGKYKDIPSDNPIDSRYSPQNSFLITAKKTYKGLMYFLSQEKIY